jgi:C-terminal processing protease CtpA/Prc
VVEAVQEFSPAAIAGILAGDEIWMINEIRADSLSLGDINRMLRKQSGQKIELIIRRGKEYHWIQFELRPLF